MTRLSRLASPAISVLLLTLAATAQAADKANAFSLSGNLQRTQQTQVGDLVAGYERMWTDSISTELSVAATHIAVTGLPSTTSYLILVKPKYYFGALGKAGTWVPYVAAGFGGLVSGQDLVGNPSFVGLYGGVEAAVSEATSGFVEVGQGHYSGQGRAYAGTQVNLGLKLRF